MEINVRISLQVHYILNSHDKHCKNVQQSVRRIKMFDLEIVKRTGSWGHLSIPWKSLSKTKVFAHFPHTVGYKTSGVISGRQVSYSATTA